MVFNQNGHSMKKNPAVVTLHTHCWLNLQGQLFSDVRMIVDELVHPLDGSRVLRVRWQVTDFIVCVSGQAHIPNSKYT